jgi:thiazole synthase ThiGH ThiG subunit
VQPPVDERNWAVAGAHLSSRLILGSGGFADLPTFSAALAASGADMVTVAMRRIEQAPPGLLEAITAAGARVLPNTAGCYTAAAAVPRADAPARSDRHARGGARLGRGWLSGLPVHQ